MRNVIHILLFATLNFELQTLNCFAQDRLKIDSLESLLKTNIADTTRIKTLNTLGWQLKYRNPDTSILLGKQALQLSERVILSGVEGWQEGIANTNNKLGVYYWIKGDYPLSLSYHFKALEIRNERQKGNCNFPQQYRHCLS